jgi:predicted porin
MKKILPLLSLFSIPGASATNDTDDIKLLHEIIADQLQLRDKFGPDSGFGDLSFRGRLELTALFMRQKLKGNNDNSVRSMQGSIDCKYSFKQGDCTYGAEIGVKTHSGIIKQGGQILRTSCLFWESPRTGTVKIGYSATAADLFCVFGDKFLAGYGGPGSGNLGIFFNESAGSLVDTGFPFDDRKAMKIAFLSPKVSGFSFGLSFTPDSRDATLFKTYHKKPHSDEINIERANFPGIRTGYSKNIVTLGAACEYGNPESLQIGIAAAVWLGKGKSGIADDKEVHNVRAFNLGGTICRGAFKASVGYTDNGKSMRPRSCAVADIDAFDESKDYHFSQPEVGIRPGADVGRIFSAGIAYAVRGGPVISAGYFRSAVKFSAREKSVAEIVSLAAEYTINRAVSVYAEYNNVRTTACARARAYGKACGLSTNGDNRGNMFMIGTKINF